MFLRNYRDMTSFSKYFTMGNDSKSLNLKFAWYDSFSGHKVQSQSPQLPRVSSLYNLGVALCREACYMDLAGDGIKQASKQFRSAAWVFEEAMKAATQLPVDCYSVDFSKEALNMNTNLCLAQAQYLFLKKATDAGMNAGILAKVAS